MKMQLGKIIIMFLAIGLIAGIASAADIDTNILAYWALDADAKDTMEP